jgi:hypothetical protein
MLQFTDWKSVKSSALPNFKHSRSLGFKGVTWPKELMDRGPHGLEGSLLPRAVTRQIFNHSD